MPRVRLLASLSNLELIQFSEGTADQAPAGSRLNPASPSRKQLKDDLQAQIAELVRCYQNGATVKRLAADYGMHHRTVKKRLQSAGVVIRERERKLSERQIGQAVRLYGQGMSTQQIGDVFKVSHNTVRRHLRNRGVQMRPMGRPPRQD